MKQRKKYIHRFHTAVLTAVLILLTQGMICAQQKIRLGIHGEPVVSWYGSDIDSVVNKGVRSGFNFGVSLECSFSSNYSFSTGLNLYSSGGTLTPKGVTVLELTNQAGTVKYITVQPGNNIIYKVQYISVPAGLKLKTNQIGYITYFTDFGLDPKVMVSGKIDIPSGNISGENAKNELMPFNLGYHIRAGIEYSLGGNTAFTFGLGFENNFLDVTRENNNQPPDKITQRTISFRFGVIF